MTDVISKKPEGPQQVIGVVLNYEGKELIERFKARADFHTGQAVKAREELPKAAAAMEQVRKAHQVAGRPTGGSELDYEEVASAGVVSASALRRSVVRSHGEDVENPVDALRLAISHHTHRSVFFREIAEHLNPGWTYVLSDNQMEHYELLNDH
jgi:hypothetical protein